MPPPQMAMWRGLGLGEAMLGEVDLCFLGLGCRLCRKGQWELRIKTQLMQIELQRDEDR